MSRCVANAVGVEVHEGNASTIGGLPVNPKAVANEAGVCGVSAVSCSQSVADDVGIRFGDTHDR